MTSLWAWWDFLYVLLVNCFAFGLAWIVIFTWARVSWVDVLWAASMGIWALDNLSFRSESFRVGAPLTLLSAIYLLWSVRLSFHLGRRLGAHPSHEDPRYQKIKDESKKSWPAKSFLIFQMNAVLVSLLVLPQRILLWSEAAVIAPLTFVGAATSVLAIAGEATADAQLKAFASRAENRGKTLQSGLWKYSRHPNYFFEWLFWVGIFLMTIPYPSGYWSLICPVVMYVFLTQFTGIKISEQGAAARRKDFGTYREKTSAFFPLPPKRL